MTLNLRARRFGLTLVVGFLIGAIAVGVAIASDDEESSSASDAPARATAEATAPDSVLGTTDADVVIGGGPPRFATPDPRRIPVATPAPVPDERTGLDLPAARRAMAELPGVSAVIDAIDARDAERLTELISTRAADCARPEFPIWTGRGTTLEECIAANGADPDGLFDAVYSDGFYQSIVWMPGLFKAALSSEPVELYLATRTDSPEPTVFLVVTTAPVDLDALSPKIPKGILREAIAFEVRVREEAPITQVQFLSTRSDALKWVQLIGPEAQQLVFPETLAGFERLR